jgi:ATP adenylyltransferase
MDYIFSPWRYRYMSRAREQGECILCAKLKPGNDRENLVLFRGSHNAILLNLFPYTTGHLMILPYSHLARLSDCPPATRGEMMELAARSETVLQREYRPQGINIGLNVGEAAGAGIAGHIHLHVVPRWFGDSNFMTTVAETRILPEDLQRTWERLQPLFAAAP